MSAATVIDSEIFRDLFGTDEMRAIFSDDHLVVHYLAIEGALAKVQGQLGIIPVQAARKIARQAQRLHVDLNELRRDTTNVGYPIVGIVRQLARACGRSAGEYVHWGATTQDIMDTAVVLQIREALAALEVDLLAVTEELRKLARRHRNTPMAGRTHLQQALPVTFGYKCAVWLSGLERHRERLRQLRPRVLVGQFAGAAGTLASLGVQGPAVQKALMRELKLGYAACPWHVARDNLAEAVSWLGLVTGTLSKIAGDISILSMTEMGEVAEPFVPGRGSSSTMPQKQNPIACEVILGCGRIVRQQSALMLDAMVHDFERATGPWHVEWLVLPEAFILAAASLRQARLMLAGLRVDAVRMRQNLDLTRGAITAEAVMMKLGATIGRQSAHRLIYDACCTSRADGRSLYDVLAANPTVRRHLATKDLARLLDPTHYLGNATSLVDRLKSRARSAASPTRRQRAISQ